MYRRNRDKKVLRAMIIHKESAIHALRTEMPYREPIDQALDRKCIFDLERELSDLKDELKRIENA